MPTNVEELRTITNSTQGTAAEPTLPERDHFLEGGIIHRFPVAGIVAKLSGYYKQSEPGVDDGTIPGTAIVTAGNNYQEVLHRAGGGRRGWPQWPLSRDVDLPPPHAHGARPRPSGFF